MKFVEVRTTFESEKDAQRMAEFLLDEKLVACGQIQKIESHYVWKNERFITQEFMLTLKTRKALCKCVEKVIKERHPYDLPEICCSKIDCSKEYATWIKGNTK